MTTTTANGLPATAVRGVPNTWIVRTSAFQYEAIETNGVSIGEVDTSALLLPGDWRWRQVGRAFRTWARDCDTPEDGRHLAGWYAEVDHDADRPYRRAADALWQLKCGLRELHTKRQGRHA